MDKNSQKKDLTGIRYGKLLVVEEAPPQYHPCGARSTMWRCVCDCGNVIVASTGNLNRNHYVSCGCVRKNYVERARSAKPFHGGCVGGRRERLYKVWSNMKERCYNPHSIRFSDWGGRGIKICPEWRNDYAAFRKWALDHGYDEKAKRGECTIDRIDVNGDYCPQNCRFVNSKVQAKNRRPRKRKGTGDASFEED